MFQGGLVAGIEHQRAAEGEGAVVASPHRLAAAHGSHEIFDDGLVGSPGFGHYLEVGVLAILLGEDVHICDGIFGGADRAHR